MSDMLVAGGLWTMAPGSVFWFVVSWRNVSHNTD